jgi:hypothetical protein
MPLRTIFEAEKNISVAVAWTAPDRDDGYIRFSAPLEMEGVTEAGLLLTGGAYQKVPDQHMTFELAVWGLDGARRTRLVRLDWRSLKGGHSNPSRCGDWAGQRVPPTHLHCFDLNWIEEERRMRKGKLPCARPLDSEPQSFEDLREFVGIHFRIKNIGIVPRPEWEYNLFGNE